MTCNLCQRSQRDGFRNFKCQGIETIDQCPTGEIARLAPENERFWDLFSRILPGLCDGFGGFNYRAIEFVMDVQNVSAGQRPIIFDKCLIMISVIEEGRAVEKAKHG
ncbi:hypothetical protein KKE60_07720 [Patescibacteria group bacterium]|nr:hypothetical protein [Patescibacteria group bacterium]